MKGYLQVLSENEKGTSLLITLPEIPSSSTLGLTNVLFPTQTQEDIKIIGWKFHRNDLIVISTTSDGTTDGIGHIWLIPFNIGIGEPVDTIAINKHLIYVGELNLNPNSRIRKIICRYEFGDFTNGGLYKIYWTDGKNLLRHLNLLEKIHYHTGTHIIDINENNIEVLPYIGYQAPITLEKVISGGNFKAGMVQYAYQFYKLYGSVTKFSPASKLIHLTDSNEYATNNSNYFGDPIDTYTGKAVQIIVPAVNNSIFDRVRIISLFYNSYNSTPEIKVIADIDAVNSPIHITDINNPTIDIPPTLVEYTTLGGNIFTCQDMEVKDNRLIPANITTIPGFDITWDSRAYRFNNIRDAGLFTSSQVLELTINGDSPDWNVPLTNDCFNLFNEIKQGNDANTTIEFMYQKNGTTLGGEGPNIKYEFIIKTIELDEGNEIDGDSNTIGKIQTILNTDSNQSYTDYSSPYIHSEFVGYHRDEIYAFAIEWFDQYGRSSFTSWIGDIRFPRIYDEDDHVTYESNTDYSPVYKKLSDHKNYANILGIKFTIKTVPIGVTAFRIVRCPVTQFDRTIAFQGLMEPTVYDPSDPSNINYPAPVLTDLNEFYPGTITGGTINASLVNINTPDPIFFKGSFIFQTNDFISLPALYDGSQGVSYYKSSFIGGMGQPSYSKLTSIMNYGTVGSTSPKANTISIVDAKTVTPSESNDATIRIGNANFLNYNAYYVPSWSANANIGYRGSNITVNLSSAFDYRKTIGGSSEFYLANYKRNITPYGGSSYSTRAQRYYIPCTDVTSITVGSTNVPINVYGGDTYISYFSYLRNFTDYKPIRSFLTDISNNSRSLTSLISNGWIGFPVETRLNLDLRHDKLLQWYKRSNPEFTPISISGGSAWHMNSGTNILTWTFGISIPFSTSDVGKTIRVPGAGTAGADMIGTIIGYTDINNITLSFDAITTVSSGNFYYANLNLPYWILQETQSKGLEIFPNYYPEDVKDLYLYNSVYSKENDVNKYYSKPLNFQEVTQYGNRIKASDKRISGNTIDQWLNFPVNLFKDVDSPYGNINALKLFKDQLFFFQDSGFGIQPINERSTTVDESGTQIVLGEGEILGKYGYISRITGCKHQTSLITTEDQMHFFDIRLKRWNLYTGNAPLPLSSVSGLHSYFMDKIYPQYEFLLNDSITAPIPYGIHGVFDTQNNRILMTFLSHDFVETLSYNLFTNTFEAFYDFAPTLYLQAGDNILAISNETTGRGLIYQHGSGDYGLYYGSDTYAKFSISFIVNKNPDNLKIFNNLSYNSYIEISDVEAFDTDGITPFTLDTIQVTNDYQDTGTINLVIFPTVPGTSEVTVRRRFRLWNLQFPRSIAMKTGDRTDARLHGQYILVNLKFINNNNKRLILHDVTTHFNVS
jgi:hypothetical protein